MLEIVKGDLLVAKEKYIAHVCNAVSNQAGGLAYYLFKKYPHANIYKNRPYPYIPQGPDFPGHIVKSGDGSEEKRFVINMIAQYYPGTPVSVNSLKDGTQKREYYFSRCLYAITYISDLESIAFPYKIGCGLAGGNWEAYLRMIRSFEDQINHKQKVRVVVYDNEEA